MTAAAEPLRRRGRRVTRTRLRVLDLLARTPEAHWSAEQVAAQLPGENLATVYRTLDLLVAEGLARRTRLGRERDHFEAARRHRHHHLVCDACGAVVHAHDGALGDLARSLSRSTGWALGTAELTLHGRCPGCA